MKKIAVMLSAALSAAVVFSQITFDAGADLRVRQEFYDNAPLLPGDGRPGHSGLQNAPGEKRGNYVNRMRFRPRVWGEVNVDERLRFYMRLADEFRWNVQPNKRSSVFPDELFLDNLLLEGKGFFDGFLDFTVGRQDIANLYGLSHIFQDGTPGDGSRSLFSDMIRFTLNFEEDSKLDLFGLYDQDQNHLRWGNERSRNRSLTGLGESDAECERDEWGFGAVWSSMLAEGVEYQIFAMHKNTAAYMRGDVKRPSTRRELVGGTITPYLNDEWFLKFEGSGQIGENGEGETLYGRFSYVGINWKSATESSIKPFASLGLRFMSGSEDTAETDGGHGAWDPMWSRAVCYSELFSYGPHYATCWWSNLYYARMEAGLDMGKKHSLVFSAGPMFAAADDGLGGGDGNYKGCLSTCRYSFPLMLADKDKGDWLEIFGHIHLELFNPGDYFESSKPAYFARWQVEFKF
jgi:hypothetical protein